MIVDYRERFPEIARESFIARGVYILGRVVISRGVSVWYNSTLRGDINDIIVGENTNIQDNTVIHVDDDYAAVLGRDTTVGHNVIIHACNIGDECLIGMGSIIMDGAKIGNNCIVGAGSLVPPGKEYPSGSLIVGSPARVKRELVEKEFEHIRESARRYKRIWQSYKDMGIPVYTSP